jgi:hypothetical protein
MEPTKPKLIVSPKGYQQAFDLVIETTRDDQLHECVRAAFELLKKSPKFKAIVDRLNRKYVSAVALDRFEPDAAGVLTTGKFSGRRTLAFETLTLTKGNRFLRAGSHEIEDGAGFPLSDWICLKPPFIPRDLPEIPEIPDESQMERAEREKARAEREKARAEREKAMAIDRGKCIAGLIGPIAHETVHADNPVTAAPSPSLKDRAAAFITEEIATRKKEKEILEQLLSLKVAGRGVLETAEKETNSNGLRAGIKNRVVTIEKKLARGAVERDFVSGTHLTYLEKFVNDALVSKSMTIREGKLIKQGKLPPDQVSQKVRKEVQESKALVGRLEFLGSIGKLVQSKHPERLTQDPETELLTVFLPEIALLLLARRIQEEHWQETKPAGIELEHWQKTKPAEFELTLERHQDVFFPKEKSPANQIRYTPLPP